MTKKLDRATASLIAVVVLSACPASPGGSESQPGNAVVTTAHPDLEAKAQLQGPPVATPDSVSVWVPRVAPDTIPDWVFAPENRATKLLSCAAADYVRNVVTVAFYPGTTRQEKVAAVRAVGGLVVGGSEFDGTDGFYYLKIDAGPDGEGLCRASDALAAFPQVIMAPPITFIWKADQGEG